MERRVMTATTTVRRFISDRSGNTAIEYAIITAMMAGALVPAIHLVQSGLVSTLASVAGASLGGQFAP